MKLKTLLLTGVVLIVLLMKTNAQPMFFVTHFDTPFGKVLPDTGGWVQLDFSNKELFARTDSVGPDYYPYQCVHFWWGQDFGIKFRENPYIKFRAKRTTPKQQTLIISFGVRLNNAGPCIKKKITCKINLTSEYKDFVYDMTKQVDSIEKANPGYVLFNIFEFEFVLTPLHDDGFYLDDFMIGDSANPCATKKPVMRDLPFTSTLNLNDSLPTDILMTGITDGNGDTLGPITVTAVSSDPSIVPDPQIIYNSPDTSGTLRILGAQPPKSGSAFITVTVTNSAFCRAITLKTMTVKVNAENGAITWSEAGKLSVFPNPASDRINVTIPAGTGKIDLISPTGIIIKSVTLTEHTGTAGISVSDLDAGWYLVRAGNNVAPVIITGTR